MQGIVMRAIAGTAVLAASTLPVLADSARPPEKGLLTLVSGGWASRVEGKRSTYDNAPYGQYGYGYQGGYGPGYGAPVGAYGPYGGPADEDGYAPY